MMHYFFLKGPALSFKHTIVLEKETTPPATTLFLLQKHQNSSFSNV
jgi:hypothetical protein